MTEDNFKYKNTYTGIFGLNYFTQGINTSIFTMVIPIYLLTTYGVIESAALAFMLSIVMIPATIKIIYGILTDKVGSKKFGRRKPWIIFPASFGGIVWLIVSFITQTSFSMAVSLFTIAGIIVFFGMFTADTALDGFILDICPKEKLGSTQGFCWGLRAIGIIIGGPVILLFLIFLPLQIILIGLGISMILFSLMTLLIQHIDIDKEINVVQNLKAIFKKGENWKVFAYSFFMQIVGGVVYTFLSLYILIRADYINPSGATLSSLDSISLYEPQALITLIISIGIIVGALLGGFVADKVSRRAAVFSSMALNTVSLVLLLIPFPIIILIVISFFIGIASGWIFSSYSAVVAEYAQKYPDMTSTYFSISISFINFGTLLGLTITGIMFNIISNVTNDVLLIYGTIFIFMAILESIALIPFLAMDRNQYEYKLSEHSEAFVKPP
ncbi:MAG: MFS transporter [Candidatus Lokiarchaeota archaeon]|nr:MFS transporter [Candidatus Lokiarchaeota archaeon]MBD3338901.1 MFS transporter [Candidatus Lokiarchaeota archaeon]